MSGRGEHGEHFATSSVLSSRVLGRDRETASLLPLLTPEARVDAPSWLDALHPGDSPFDLQPAVPAANAGMISPGSTDPRESLDSARPAPRSVNPVSAPWMQPSDRLVRVLAEGLRSIAERGAREKQERRNRAIIVPPIEGDAR